MSKYFVAALDINTKHDINFIVNRPPDSRSDLYVIMCFSTPYRIMTANGLKEGKPGDCFINTPDFIQYHSGIKEQNICFINDWIHIKSQKLGDIMNMYRLPVNQIIHTKDELLLRPFLSDIRRELNYNMNFSQNKIDLQIELMFIAISRALINSREINNESKRTQYQNIYNLREDIISNKKYNYTVSDMANQMKLSVSRFNVLYKQIFNVSPKADLLNIKIEAAKLKLINTSDKLNIITGECCFSNEYYFSRVFFKKVGLPPGKYRQSLGV
ncbi:MAG: AraC family transcriptional regulator [Eubacteriales bacterium]